MKLIRILGSLLACGVMATCGYGRTAEGDQSFTGGVTFDLPQGPVQKGYAK